MTRYEPAAGEVSVQSVVESADVIRAQLQFVIELFRAAIVVCPIGGATERFHFILADVDGDITGGKGSSSYDRPRVEGFQQVLR